MSQILCTGIATLDIVNEVADYPHEDDEIRIVSQQKRRGGNAANTAVILSQLGHQCYWAGTLIDIYANDSDSRFIINDLDKYHINYEHCHFLKQGKVPTSYIILSQKSGSRTITHYRDLPEYSFKSFSMINLQRFNWLHFEGRNIEQTLKMMHHSKNHHPNIPISIEIEKSREGIEELIPYADIVFFSKNYVLEQGYHTTKRFFNSRHTTYPDKTLFCAWGDAGAAAFSRQQYYWQNAIKIDAIDTIAAGDVFNAAIIDQQLKRQSIEKSLGNACIIAGNSCKRKGMALE
ncbi:MAG: ketohexokinase [gamma proteobacterium symbiont of Taylorina sp.]|nr:ketohexokinase [gamma proteobacterium symbiont of Taylorina sp.]